MWTVWLMASFYVQQLDPVPHRRRGAALQVSEAADIRRGDRPGRPGPMRPAMWRLALLAAGLAWLGAASAAEPAHEDKQLKKHAARHAPKHASKHTTSHDAAHTPAHKPASAHAHKPTHAHAHEPTHTHTHATAHKPAHKPAQASARVPAHVTAAASASTTARRAAHAAALAASQAPAQPALPLPKSLRRPAPSNADPKGEGFLNLYVELCVKRIGEIDAFHDKLLRENVPKLQPDSASMFLAGMAGDAWPVPYKGKMGNFVLVLPAQKNVCMLYARRTDTAAVEQGFADLVATAPVAMRARRGPETHALTASNGATRTVSTNWAPPGSERKMQFMLTTAPAPDAQIQALGSVAIVVGADAGPGPDRAGAGASAGKVTRTPNGSPAPAPRPRAQP
jgi:hypothetical protein